MQAVIKCKVMIVVIDKMEYCMYTNKLPSPQQTRSKIFACVVKKKKLPVKRL